MKTLSFADEGKPFFAIMYKDGTLKKQSASFVMPALYSRIGDARAQAAAWDYNDPKIVKVSLVVQELDT